MSTPKPNTTTRKATWKALIAEADPKALEKERVAYEFSNGRKFKETDKNGVYE